MGAHPYFYFVKHNPDINAALQELRDREFSAGRYNPVIRYLEFPLGPDSPVPGAQHKSIRHALKAADAEGTRSILDLDHVSDEPEFCAVAPLPQEELERLFGTVQPTREMIEASDDLFENIESGQGVYVTVFKDGRPDELFFAGYSFD
jgi:hypothetical protein